MSDTVDKYASIVLKAVDYDIWKEEQVDDTGLLAEISIMLEDFFDEAIVNGVQTIEITT